MVIKRTKLPKINRLQCESTTITTVVCIFTGIDCLETHFHWVFRFVLARSARDFYKIPSVDLCDICEGNECSKPCDQHKIENEEHLPTEEISIHKIDEFEPLGDGIVAPQQLNRDILGTTVREPNHRRGPTPRVVHEDGSTPTTLSESPPDLRRINWHFK